MAAKVWFNGKLVDPSQARLDFLTPALHYGIAVFEGIRSYATASGQAIFRLDDHIERLLQSARVLGFRTLPWSEEELRHACVEVARESGFHECYIRPLIYLAEGGWNLTVDAGKPYCGIAAWEWTQYLGADALAHGAAGERDVAVYRRPLLPPRTWTARSFSRPSPSRPWQYGSNTRE